LLIAAWAASASAEIELRGAVLGSGAADAATGETRARATIGQVLAGPAGDAFYDAKIGFWYLLSPAIATGLQEGETIPSVFQLDGNRPNPFNPKTMILFSLAEAGRVQLRVYDPSGRLAATLVDRELSAGSHEVVLQADRLASGVYFYRLDSGGRTAVRRMVLLR